jgi:hypothetical protein
MIDSDSLSLSQYIDVPGTTAICKALETNKHLQYIDLGMNRVRKVSDAKVIAFSPNKLMMYDFIAERSSCCYFHAGSQHVFEDTLSKVELHP